MEKITEKSAVKTFKDKFEPNILRQVVLGPQDFEMDISIVTKILNMVIVDVDPSQKEDIFISRGADPLIIESGATKEARAIARNLVNKLDQLEWTWDSKNGSLIKRLRSHVKKFVNHKLSNDACGKIGAYVSDVIPKPSTYYFDFTDTFNWSAGEFGDSGSCFFRTGYGRSDYVDSRMQMQENGNFLAFRLFTKLPADRTSNLGSRGAVPYNDDENIYIGYSRSWINTEKIDDETVCLFNTYGGIKTKTAATILNAYLEGYATMVSYRNCGWYVNSDPYALASSEIQALKVLGTGTKIFVCDKSSTKPAKVDTKKFKAMPYLGGKPEAERVEATTSITAEQAAFWGTTWAQTAADGVVPQARPYTGGLLQFIQ